MAKVSPTKETGSSTDTKVETSRKKLSKTAKTPASSKAKAVSKAVTKSKSKTKTQTKTTGSAAAKKATTAKSGVKVKAKPTPKSTVKAKAKPAAKSTVKAKAKPTPKSSVKAKANPAAKASTKAKAKALTKAAAKKPASKTLAPRAKVATKKTTKVTPKPALKSGKGATAGRKVPSTTAAKKPQPVKKQPVKAARAKKLARRTRKVDYMNQEQRNFFREQLEEWRVQLLSGADNAMNHIQIETQSYPDDADRASQEEGFSIELRTRDRERKLIRKIDHSLELIDKENYGYCASCGVEIGVRRLQARLTATLCIDCKTLEESKEKHLVD